MDKATQKSIEWQKANNPMAIGGDSFADIVDSFNVNPAFVAGYKEAEKDLSLTWKDVADIVILADTILDGNEEEWRKRGPQAYYEAVLKALNDKKK